MLIQCKSNTGKLLPTNYSSLGFAAEAVFDLSVMRTYPVYGIALWQGVILYLVSDDHGLPNWHPHDLFVTLDSRLSNEWRFAVYEAGDQLLQALWGYERLICDEDHYDALLERDPKAIEFFVSERNRIHPEIWL